MDAVGVHSVVPGENKLSKVEILRALISERMTVAVREILAVVETTVSGYDDEVSSLNQQLDKYKRKLDAVLQPQIHLSRIDGVGTSEITSRNSNDDTELAHQDLQRDAEIMDCTASESCAEENTIDNITIMFQQETLTEHEESNCSSADPPNDSLESSCSSPGEEGLGDDSVNNVQNTKSKRTRRMPGRYISNHNLTEDCTGIDDNDNNGDNEWMPCKNKKRWSSNVKKNCLIKFKIGLLKNSPGSDLSVSDFSLEGPVQTIVCHQNLSKLDFIKRLRATFPELGKNASFAAYLVNKSAKKSVPRRANKVTLDELYEAFKSQEQKQIVFYLQSKEPGDTCDMFSKQNTNGLETDDASNVLDDIDNISDAVVVTAQNKDNNSLKPSRDNEDEAHSEASSKKNIDKDPQEQMLSCKSCQVCGYFVRSTLVLVKHALSHLDNPKLMCGVCGKQLESSETLKTHLETHQKLHQCETCGRYFVTFRALQIHTDTHEIQNSFKCRICQKCFASDGLLKEHVLLHEKKMPYKCDTCHKSFKFKTQFQIHYREHTGEKPYCCNECGKSFTTYRGLSQHKLIHLGEKHYKCQQCGKLFYTLRFLKQHEKIHTVRDKKHLCDTCSKTFHTRQELVNHMKRHTNSHVVKCPFCDKLLTGNLARHMSTHTGEKPIGCKECDKKFANQSNLKTHMQAVHLGIKPLTCTVCGYKCARKHYLDYHMMTHTGHKPYKCTLCDQAFTQSHCLKTHMKSHHAKDESYANILA